MTDESHARHRPPTDRDPAQAAPRTSFGQPYPEHDILAVVEDRPAGEQVLRSLRHAGVPEGDMDLVEPAWLLEAGRAFEERRGVLQRLAALLAAQEGSYAAEYEEEARDGHPVLVVHAGDRAGVDRIRGVLKGHGARRIRYYGHFTIEDL